MSTPAQPDNAPAEPSTQPATPPAPEGTPAPTPPEPTATPATPAPEQQPEPTAPTEPKGKSPKFEGEFDPAKFEKLVENIRGDVAAEKAKREAAEKRVSEIEQSHADFIKKLAGLAGVKTDEEKPPTPEELAKQLADEQARTKASDDRTREIRVEHALYKAAHKLQADAELLTAVLAHGGQLAKLDPNAESFSADVEQAVKAAVEANPKLKAKAPEPKEPAPTPAAGAPMDGAPGGKRQLGKADVDRMTPEQIDQAVKDGRLKSYLGG
ncbi:hypothetical protein STENM36S_06392 [Streptomyces tendae]